MLRLDYSDIGDFGVVLDQQTSATGLAATALGAGAQANGDFNTAIGAQTETTGKSAVAIGGIADVLEDQMGPTSPAPICRTPAPGVACRPRSAPARQAIEYAATAIGGLANASGIRSVASGYVTQATGYDATAVGDRTEATQDWATAYGAGARANGLRSTALGAFSNAWAENRRPSPERDGQQRQQHRDRQRLVGRGPHSVAIGKATVWNGYFLGEGDPILYVDSLAMGHRCRSAWLTFGGNRPNAFVGIQEEHWPVGTDRRQRRAGCRCAGGSGRIRCRSAAPVPNARSPTSPPARRTPMR